MNSFTTFTTAADAIAEISAAINAGEADASDYDLDAILDQAFAYDHAPGHLHDAGFVQVVPEDRFWEIVAANARA